MTGDDEYGYGMGDRESEKRVSLIVGVSEHVVVGDEILGEGGVSTSVDSSTGSAQRDPDPESEDDESNRSLGLYSQLGLL